MKKTRCCVLCVCPGAASGGAALGAPGNSLFFEFNPIFPAENNRIKYILLLSASRSHLFFHLSQSDHFEPYKSASEKYSKKKFEYVRFCANIIFEEMTKYSKKIFEYVRFSSNIFFEYFQY